jgi:hypothetical protein
MGSVYEQSDVLDKIKRNRSDIVNFCYGSNRNELRDKYVSLEQVKLQNLEDPPVFR